MDIKNLVLILLLVIGVCFSTSATIVGYLVNASSSPVNNATIELWNQSMGGSNPTAAMATNYSGADGNYTLIGDFDANSMYYIKAYLDNGTSVLAGPAVPSMPYQMFFLGANGTNITLKDGIKLVINATNRSGGPTNLSGGVFYAKYDFPILQNFGPDGVENFTLYVPKGYNYSILAMMPFGNGGSQEDFFYGAGRQMQFNLSDASIATLKYVNLTLRFNTSNNWTNSVVSGNLSVYGGNPSGINFTNLTLYPYQYGGMGTMLTFQPFNPFGTVCNVGAGGPEMCGNLNHTAGDFNFTEVTAQDGISYMLIAYANNGTNYFVGYQNITLYNNQNYSVNITLREVAGSVVDGVNTSWDLSFKRVNITQFNASGSMLTGSNAGQIRVDFDFDNNGTSVPVRLSMVSSNGGSPSPGYFAIPLSTMVTSEVFSPQSSPRKFKFNTSVNSSYAIMLTSDDFMDQNGDSIMSSISNVAFYNPDPACTVPELLDSCKVHEFDPNNNTAPPIKILYMGFSPHIVMTLTTGSKLIFKNVDLIGSGPPGMNAQLNPTDLTSSSSYRKKYFFGSYAPDVYESAYTSVTYTDVPMSGTPALDETQPVNILLSSLVDYDGNEVWNTSMNMSEIPSYWGDFNTTWFNATAGGMPCSTNNSGADCYMNTSVNRIWMKMPHFSASVPDLRGTASFASSTYSSDTVPSKKEPSLSKAFECSSGKLEVSAAYSGTAISSLELKLYNTRDYSYVSKPTGSNGKAEFTISVNGNYEVDSASTSSYYASVLGPFPLELCPAAASVPGIETTVVGATVAAEETAVTPAETVSETVASPVEEAVVTVAVTKEEALVAISSGDSVISASVKAGKDVAEARAKLDAASAALNAGDYEQAKTLAAEAEVLAKNAKAKAVATTPAATTTAKPTTAPTAQKGLDLGMVLIGVVVVVVIIGLAYFLMKGNGRKQYK